MELENFVTFMKNIMFKLEKKNKEHTYTPDSSENGKIFFSPNLRALAAQTYFKK